MQLMVQHGSVHSFRGDSVDTLEHLEHPVFIKAMVLEEQKTKRIFEGVLRSLPHQPHTT